MINHVCSAAAEADDDDDADDFAGPEIILGSQTYTASQPCIV